MKQIKWFRNAFLLGVVSFVLFAMSCNQGKDPKKGEKKNNDGKIETAKAVEIVEMTIKGKSWKKADGNEVKFASDFASFTKDDIKNVKGMVDKKSFNNLVVEKLEPATVTPTKEGVKFTVFVKKGSGYEAGKIMLTAKKEESSTPTVTDLKLTELKYKGANISIADLNNLKLEVENGVQSIVQGDITAKFTYGASNEHALDNATVTIKDAPVALVAGVEKAITLEVAALANKYNKWTATLKVTRKAGTPTPTATDLKLTELKYKGANISIADLNNLKLEVENGVQSIVQGDITAKFTYGASNEHALDNATVTIKDAPVALVAGVEKAITLEVAALANKYNKWTATLKVTRKAGTPTPTATDLKLTELKYKGANISIADLNNLVLQVENAVDKIEQGDITAKFTYGASNEHTLDNATVTIKDAPVALVAGTPKDITLEVAAVANKYNKWTATLKVTRKN